MVATRFATRLGEPAIRVAIRGVWRWRMPAFPLATRMDRLLH